MHYPDTSNPSVEWMKVSQDDAGRWVSTILLGEKEISRTKGYKSFKTAFSSGEKLLEAFKDERGSN